MKEKGYEIGRDFVLEARYAEGDISRLPALAAELAKLKPQIVVTGTEAAALAAKEATANIPIVGINMVDPVRNGLIKSVSRPGGISRERCNTSKVSPKSSWNSPAT